MTMRPAADSSQPAPESIEPPNDSIAVAISGADMLVVPLVKSSPARLAVPARSGLSASAPWPMTTLAARSGSWWRSTTITRNPLPRVASCAWANLVSCGAEGFGAVSTPPIARADSTVVRQNAAAKAARMTKPEMRNPKLEVRAAFSFILTFVIVSGFGLRASSFCPSSPPADIRSALFSFPRCTERLPL